MYVAADQQRPVVAAALEVVDVGAHDLDDAQRLQAEQPQQWPIAQALQLVVVWHSAEQQRQFGFAQPVLGPMRWNLRV